MDHHDEHEAVSKRQKIDNNDNDDDDRLSSLPEAILANILSLVPIGTAVSTSVLAKRWRNRWTQLPSVKLCKNYGNDDFFAVANSVILKLSSPALDEVSILDIPAGSHITSCGYFLDAWISLIRGRCVKKLLLSVAEAKETIANPPNPSPIPLPPCTFLCRSLVQLNLGTGFKYRLPADENAINLPNLKKLQICLFLRDDHQLEFLPKLLKSCPLLDELHVTENHVSEKERNISIVAVKLKRFWLMILTPYVLNNVTIDAPNLEYIEIYDKSYAAYTFAEIPRTLASAVLQFRWPDELSFKTRYQTLHHILQSMSSVTQLCIRPFRQHALTHLEEIGLPVLEHLRSIKALWFSLSHNNILMRFLQCCPNVETVKLRCWKAAGSEYIGAIDSIQPADCLLTKVKTIEIQKLVLNDKDDEPLVLAKYILTNAKVLELLVIDVYADVKHNKALQMCKETEFCEELLKFPTSSTVCRIVFVGKYLKISRLANCLITQRLGLTECLLSTHFNFGFAADYAKRF